MQFDGSTIHVDVVTMRVHCYVMHPFVLCIVQTRLLLVSWANAPITLFPSPSISRLSFSASRVKKRPCVLSRYGRYTLQSVLDVSCVARVACISWQLWACSLFVASMPLSSAPGKSVPRTSNPREMREASLQGSVSLSLLEVCGWRSSSPATWCHHFSCELMLPIVTCTYTCTVDWRNLRCKKFWRPLPTAKIKQVKYFLTNN